MLVPTAQTRCVSYGVRGVEGAAPYGGNDSSLSF